MPDPFTARQSILRGFTQCPRRTYADIVRDYDGTVGYSEASAHLGTVFHSVAERVLRTLYDHPEAAGRMSTQEGVEIAYEVYNDSDIVLPAEEADALIWLTLRFVERKWKVDRLCTTPDGDLALEHRILTPIRCQDGQTRVLSCQPDAIFAGGPATLVLPDWKSGKGQPKNPKTHQDGLPDDTAEGLQYLSNMFQAWAYSLAALHQYPAADRVLFRELHVRSGKIRQAYLGRPDMERIERLIAAVLQKLDRGLSEGEESGVWFPRPGKQCQKQCPVSAGCPIPVEQRGRGAIDSDEEADKVAAAFVQTDGLRLHLRELLKTNWEVTGRPANIGDGRQIRWDGGKGGAFEIVDTGELPAGVTDMTGAFAKVADALGGGEDTLEADLEASLRAVGGQP